VGDVAQQQFLVGDQRLDLFGHRIEIARERADFILAPVDRGSDPGVERSCCQASGRPLHFAAPLWILAFALLGGALFGALGVVAGIWADKFDQLAAFQNFLIMPLTFLSGVFYSIHSLPPLWQQVSHFNPVFYMIDGFRYGFFGVSDVSPWLSLAVATACLAGVTAFTLTLLKRGYKLRN
jgi:ABC-2 type transport system permease protein